ncbi:MAG: HIT family protein [Candidatus Micrarchaeota archaeon]|nr:HIT family protein [Candidatus Micrarchaeota archaeon]
MARGCRICELNNEDMDSVAETRFFKAHMDRHPETPGHAIITPKRHVVSLFDLTKGEWADLQAALKKTKRAVGKIDLGRVYQAFIAVPYTRESRRMCREMLSNPKIGRKPDGYNFGINEGRAAGRMIDHVHFHLIPRYLGDVRVPAGGVRNVIKNARD